MERQISYLLKNAFFDRVCEALSKPANQRMLFQYIAKFRDRNLEALSSPYIEYNIIFNANGEDANVVYRACEVEKDEVDSVLKEALKVIKLDKTERTGGNAANITPLRAILIMAMSFFFNDKAKLKSVYLYYAYSFYYSVYSAFFIRKENINMECMRYTINNMTNKFDIKKASSLELMLEDTMNVAINTYSNLFSELSDNDIVALINAFKTRVSHKMLSIRKEYQKNYDAGNRYFDVVERSGEGEYIMDRESNITMVDSLANEYTLSFFQKPIDRNIVNITARMHTVSENEIRMAIALLHDEGDKREVRQFYNAMFQLFFESYPQATKDDANSSKFLVAADAIYKKGNTNEKNVLLIKDLSHKWLKRGSNTYRSSTRPDTINRYRKAIFMYFVLVVSTKK